MTHEQLQKARRAALTKAADAYMARVEALLPNTSVKRDLLTRLLSLGEAVVEAVE